MTDVAERDVLKAGRCRRRGDAAERHGPGGRDVERAAAESGAQLRVLRWKQFIQAEFDSFVANTKKFIEKTGVKVRVDAESWDDIRPKSAVAANVGAGPDIIMGTLDDPFKFKQKLLDLTDSPNISGPNPAAGTRSRANTECTEALDRAAARRERRLHELSHQRHACRRLR